MTDLAGLDVPGGWAVHWSTRALAGSGEYGTALVDIEDYLHILDLGERVFAQLHGRRLPFPGIGGMGPRVTHSDEELRAVLPASWMEGDGPVVIFDSGHPLAFTEGEMGNAMRTAGVWRPPGDGHSNSVAAITDQGFLWRIFEVARIANLVRGWDRPLGQIQHAQVLWYPEGAELGWHTDDPTYYRQTYPPGWIASQARTDPTLAAMEGRTVSVIAQLSDPDEYDGGQVLFDIDG